MAEIPCVFSGHSCSNSVQSKIRLISHDALIYMMCNYIGSDSINLNFMINLSDVIWTLALTVKAKKMNG